MALLAPKILDSCFEDILKIKIFGQGREVDHMFYKTRLGWACLAAGCVMETQRAKARCAWGS